MKIKSFNIKSPLGVFFVAAFIFGAAFYVLAQTQTNGASDLPAGVTQEQAQSAFDDLSKTLGQTISGIAQAKEICNQERFLEACVEVGKKHNLYGKNEIKQVDEVFTELKTVLADDLKKCEDESCFVEVANKIAKTLAQKNPDIAKQLDLVPKKIEEKKIIINTAKDIGISFQQCQEMDTDNAPIDLLRACVKLAKDSRIQKYVPKEVKKAAEFSDNTIELRQELETGKLQCGDNTLEGCGNFCLNPSEAARAQGTSLIPPVCREIAGRFFGPDGVKQLESAYQQIRQVETYYKKKAENAVFTTQNGLVLRDPAEIGHYLEVEGGKGNTEAVGRGLDFMIANGFIKQDDKEFALKMVQKVKEQGGQADFEACRQNPELCRHFVPDDQRGHFDAFKKIEDIMRQEVGFDPFECRRGEFNEEIALKCFEGSKRALPKLEALVKDSPELRPVIADIKSKVGRGEELTKRRSEVQQVFSREGGPGGCRSDQECHAYCSDPAHGPECIAFGAKNQIFKGDEVIQRFQQFNQVLQTQQYPPEFRGPPYPGPNIGPNNYPTQGGPYQESSGRPYYPESQVNPERFHPGPGPVGPSPECFAAIQSGDFVTAKEICNVRTTVFTTPRPVPICPGASPGPCQQEGYYRPASIDQNGCSFYGECVSVPGYRTDKKIICPALPTVDTCPEGQRKIVSYSSPECGTYYSCEPVKPIIIQPPPPTPTTSTTCDSTLISLLGANCHQMYTDSSGNPIFCDGPLSKSAKRGDTTATPGCNGGGNTPYCPSGQYWNGTACVVNTSFTNTCPPGKYWNGTACVISPTTCLSGQYWDGTTCRTSPSPTSVCNYNNVCDSGESISSCPTDCHSTTPPPPPSCPSGQYWNGTACVTTTTPPSGQKQQIWNSLGLSSSIRSDADPARIDQLKQSCANVPSGASIWAAGAGDPTSPDFGMPVADKCRLAAGCTFGQYWNGTVCVTSSAGTCPSGQYWYTPPGGGAGYCQSTSTTPPSSSTCDSNLTALLGTGCHQMYTDSSGNFIFCDGSLTKSAKRGDTTVATGCTSPAGGTNYCPSGQYWNGTACAPTSTTTPPPSTTSTCSSTPSLCTTQTDCNRYNFYWCSNGTCSSNSSLCPGTTTCPTGQYWNGTSCVTSTTTVCPSGQYWNGTACVTSTAPPPSSTACNYNHVCDYGESIGSCPTDCGSTTPPPSSTTCASGQYWNGTACVTTITPPPSPPPSSTSCTGGKYWDGTACSCPSGQYWDGTACMTTTTCASGQYWNGTSCVTSTTPPPSPPPSSTSCPSGQYWTGTACAPNPTPPPSSATCPSGQYWNGTACVTTTTTPPPTPPPTSMNSETYMFAQLINSLGQLADLISKLVK